MDDAPTKTQARILIHALNNYGSTSSGRYGWNRRRLEAMQRRGWVALVATYTWDANWKLTEAGRALAQKLKDAKDAA